MNIIWQQSKILLLREYSRVSDDSLVGQLINNWVIWPVILAASNGYFVPLVLFGPKNMAKSTELFVGMGLLHILILSFVSALTFLSERLDSNVVQYQITVTSFKAVFFNRFIFGILYAFLKLIFFYPVAKLTLGAYLQTDLVSWPTLYIILFLAVIMTVAYLSLFVSLMNSMQSINHIWERGIEPLLWLGGMWAPGYAIAKSIPGGHYIATYNPFVYVTDALRQVFIPGPQYAPLATCCFVMAGSTILFTFISYHLLKWRMDSV